MKNILVLCIFASFWHFTVSLQCYTCSVGEQDTDVTCVDNPEQLTITNCNKKYCTTIRQEYKDPQGKVASMFRGCEDIPNYMNQIIEDESYRFYYSACQTDLCNGGSGKAGDSSTGSQVLGDKSTLIVPGIGAGSINPPISILLILLISYIVYTI